MGSTGSTRITGMVLTHNDAFGNGNGNIPSWPAGNPASYTYSNNSAVNPLFLSATDFKLQAASPCINTGVNVGLLFTGLAPDKGYAETGQ